MTEPPASLDSNDSKPFKPAVEGPPRRRRRIVLLVAVLLGILVAGGTMLVVWWVLGTHRPSDCESAVRSGSYGTAVGICQREWEQTRRAPVGALLAEAYERSGNLDAAKALATDLLATEARADALHILGEVAIQEDREAAAIEHFQSARKLHREERRHAEVARDVQALARIQAERGQFSESLALLDECVTEAEVASSRAIEGLCHLTAARVLTLVGQFNGARQELDRAAPLLSTDRERALLLVERGHVEQEFSRGMDSPVYEKQALKYFEQALELAEKGQLVETLIGIENSLTFSYAELKQPVEAERHLKRAEQLDQKGAYKRPRAELAARIAYRSGNLTLALSLNEQIYSQYAASEPDDDRFEVCVMQARIALQLDRLADAEKWARRGIDEAEQIRATQTSIELRPWVLATRRAPYELLFTVLARSGRAAEAITVFDQWQGRTLLDALARPSPDTSIRLTSVINKIQLMEKWLPKVAAMPQPAVDARAVLDALRTIDLFGLVIAEGNLWRISAQSGQIQIEDLGGYDGKLEEQVASFQSAPTDRARAEALGAQLVPAELFRGTSTLFVVLDAKLSGLPVVALRRNGQALIAARPVLRVPRLPTGDRACAAPTTTGAQILADARGDLPDARRESTKVAERFKTTALVGAAATSTALFAARSEPVLHVAVHAGTDAGGGILKLYDRDVSALEILASRLGPPLVVLSACSSARSDDPEIAGSLSSAFLASGSSHVIASLKDVDDAGALELTSRFYAAEGVRDPVRALAAVQAQLADSDNKTWPDFAVFGRSACAPST